MTALASLTSNRPWLRRLIASQTVLLVLTWLITRLYLMKEIGWFGGHTDYQDVVLYQHWAAQMAHTHTLPTGPDWQYPALTAWLFLVPHLINSHYDGVFCLLMFGCDLGVTATLTFVARREGRYWGVWLWLGLVLILGPMAFLRFDILPTLLTVAAIALLWQERRIGWFGTLLGAGVMVKIWPVLGLIAAVSRRELLKAFAWLVVTVVVITGLSALYFGNTFGFISNQSTRGMEIEATAATPAFVRSLFTGAAIPIKFGSGSIELASSSETSFASVLRVLMLVLAAAVVAWWVLRTRRGQTLPPVVAIDVVFVAVLGYMIVSPVLSPQYLIWLMGLGGLALCSRQTSMRRPIGLFALSVLFTRAAFERAFPIWDNAIHPSRTTALMMVLRNVVLLVAATDAVVILVRHARGQSSAN